MSAELKADHILPSGGRGGGLRTGFLWDKPEQRTSGSDKGTEEDIRAPRQ